VGKQGEVKIKTDLNRLKKRTQWSWERMCREMHRVMGEDVFLERGVSHTTLWRIAVTFHMPNPLTARWVRKAIKKLGEE